uniref:Putative secreted protein n=1 Tax=Ixodes ricinus TaxID=34613 RepID=A0A6B0UD53_IXORI
MWATLFWLSITEGMAACDFVMHFAFRAPKANAFKRHKCTCHICFFHNALLEAMSVKRCTLCDASPESLSRQNKTGRQDSRHDDGKLAWNVSSAR